MSRVLCVFALLCPTLAQAAGLNGAFLSLSLPLPSSFSSSCAIASSSWPMGAMGSAVWRMRAMA